MGNLLRKTSPLAYTRAMPLTALALSLASACKSLVGYGEERSSTPVQSAEPFTLTYTPTTAEAHQLWLDYDLRYEGEWRVTGAIDGSGSLGHWDLDFRRGGAPIQGKTGRVKLNAVHGSGSARGTIWLTELPGSSPGAPLTLSGTFTAGPETTIHAMRLVVTD